MPPTTGFDVAPLLEDETLTALFQDQLNPYPSPFKNFLGSLKTRLGVIMARLDIGIGDTGFAPVSIADFPVGEVENLKLSELSERHWREYPIKSDVKAGDIYKLDEIRSTSSLKSNNYEQTLMKPFGVDNELVMAVNGPEKVLCLLRLGINSSTIIGPQHYAFLKQLRPHLELALQTHMLTRRPMSIVNMLTDMTDVLDIGIVILDGRKRLIFSNDTAQRLAAAGSWFSLIGESLVFAHKDKVNAKIDRFFNEALSWRHADFLRAVSRSGSCREPSADIPCAVFRIGNGLGENIDVLAQPIRTFTPYRNETSPQLVAYIVDSRRRVHLPERLAERLYGLTKTEARLAVILASGSSIADAADLLGLSEGTARTYSKRIYAKLGVKRQAALVQVLHESVLLLAE